MPKIIVRCDKCFNEVEIDYKGFTTPRTLPKGWCILCKSKEVDENVFNKTEGNKNANE